MIKGKIIILVLCDRLGMLVERQWKGNDVSIVSSYSKYVNERTFPRTGNIRGKTYLRMY